MDIPTPVLSVLIGVSAVIFGIYSGRAKAARLRDLQQDLKDGKPRGYLVLAVVFFAIVLAFYSRRP